VSIQHDSLVPDETLEELEARVSLDVDAARPV